MDSMDFHSLSRRELQTLCKKNKIPANMTNIAMADALAALTNVVGIEEIGQPDNGILPETPLTSRRTTARRNPIKPQSIEIDPESSQPLTRTRRATARKTKKEDEEEQKDLTEHTSAQEISQETPVPRTGRRRVTGTSVCRKLDTQTKEDETEKDKPVVHAYSTRRSSRLQSDQKISESIQKRGGRRTEAVKIAALSEEETEDVEMESKSDVLVEVQGNKGANVMVLDPIPDAEQEDSIPEDESVTVVSAEVSSSIEEVSSAHQDLISEVSSIINAQESPMSKNRDECSVEASIEHQDMSCEVSSIINAYVSEISASEIFPNSESKVEITVENSNDDQEMSVEDSSAASENFNGLEIKEDSSPLEEEVRDFEKPNVECVMSSLISYQVEDMNNEDEALVSTETHEVENPHDEGLKFSFEDELCDIQSEAQETSVVWDFGYMKETMEYISKLERCNQVAAAPLDCEVSDVIEPESEKLDGNEEQEDQVPALPVLSLKNATVPSPREEVSEDIQVKSEKSVADEQLENQMVHSDKCDLSEDDEDTVKADSTDGDVSSDESNDNEMDESDNENEMDESDSENEINESSDSGLVENQNPMTPMRSSSAKKKATPNSRKLMINVLEDNEENKVSLRSNSKLATTVVVAEEKENTNGDNTAQKSLKSKSLRQLRKMFLNKLKLRDDTTTITTTTNEPMMIKEQLQVVENKRLALQKLNDNCLVGDKEN